MSMADIQHQAVDNLLDAVDGLLEYVRRAGNEELREIAREIGEASTMLASQAEGD